MVCSLSVLHYTGESSESLTFYITGGSWSLGGQLLLAQCLKPSLGHHVEGHHVFLYKLSCCLSISDLWSDGCWLVESLAKTLKVGL